MDVLDLFSAAAGGWSLGMHRAGFRTVAACEAVDWRRALYAQNNPGVPIYDDVCTLTADRLLADLGYLPCVIVGSPPCQDISPANTKGKGVEGERSGLYFEAVRIIGEVRPRWFALENSANLRARGADAVIPALEALGYACWAFVVGAGDVGANHERSRSWLIGCDLDQVTDPDSVGLWEQPGWRSGPGWRSAAFVEGDARHTSEDGCGSGRPWRRAEPATGLSIAPRGNDADASQAERRPYFVARGDRDRETGERIESANRHAEPPAIRARDASDADQAGQANGCLEPSLREAAQSDNGRRDVGGDDVAHADREGQLDRSVDAQVGGGEGIGDDAAEPWAGWNGGLAHHLRVDDGLSAWVAGTRVAVGGPRGTSAASLIVEAFGDAVVPQIPEAIGRAILRTEAALEAIYSREAA